MSRDFLSYSILAMILMLQILNELLTILQSAMLDVAIENFLCKIHRKGFKSEKRFWAS